MPRFSDTEKGRLYREAVALFGRERVELSRDLAIGAMAIEAELVAEGARQLRELSGQPERQRAVIEAMDEDTALALCRWILEPGCMDQFIPHSA